MGLVTVAINSPEELAALSDLDVVLVVTAAEDGAGRLATGILTAAPRIAVDASDWQGVDDGGPLEAPPPSPQGGHIVFTSGTTGLRKEIMTTRPRRSRSTATASAASTPTGRPISWSTCSTPVFGPRADTARW